MTTEIPDWTSARASVAGLKRRRPADDPQVVEAVVTLRAARLAHYISQAVDAAPPLSESQRAKLSLLLRGTTA